MTPLPIKKRIVKIKHQEEQPLDLSLPKKIDLGIDRRDRARQRRLKIKESGRYQCKVCSKSFVQQSSLTTHRRIHTGERPYKCEVCEKTYGDLSTFTKHKRVHSGEKPYNCEVCERKFSQSGNCLRHKRSVH